MVNTSEQPLVSIVLPTYNGARYLDEAIDSVLNQTFRDWELIIVDDCSIDDTPKIIRKYASQDSRIHMIRNDVNRRLPASLNVGFHSAKGKLLTWTSDDNRYLPEALDRMQRVLVTSPELVMVCADCVFIDESGNKTGLMATYDEDHMLTWDTVGACFMYRRDVLDEVGDYDIDLFCVEDYDYWQRIFKHYGHIERIPEVLYEYRFHEESLTVQKRKRVLYQNSRLLARNIDDILNRFHKDLNIMCWLYYEMRKSDYLPQDIERRLVQDLSIVSMEEPYDVNSSYLLFGAGEYGCIMRDYLGDRAIGFIDNDSKKIGTTIKNLPVMSLQDAKDQYPKEKILLTVSNRCFYKIIEQLQTQGVKKYTVYLPLLIEV